MSKKLKRFLGRHKQQSPVKKWPEQFHADENERPLFVTMTGEPLQLARIHYDLLSKDEVERAFAALECMDFDPTLKRWTWNYHAEAKKLIFQSSYDDLPKEVRPIVIGSFYFPTEQRMYVDVNSFDRTIAAVQFFDKFVSREFALLSHVQIVNKFFQAVPGMVPSQEDFFDRFSPERPDHRTYLDEIAENTTLTRNEKIELAQQDMDEHLKEKIKEVESLSINFYEDGIESLDGALKMRKIIAFEHWRGNLAFTFVDVFKKLFSKE